jgi:hypothetical protein
MFLSVTHERHILISNDLLNDVIWLKPMWDIPMDQHGEKLKHQDDCLICCKILPQMSKGNSINTVKPVLGLISV